MLEAWVLHTQAVRRFKGRNLLGWSDRHKVAIACTDGAVAAAFEERYPTGIRLLFEPLCGASRRLDAFRCHCVWEFGWQA